MAYSTRTASADAKGQLTPWEQVSCDFLYSPLSHGDVAELPSCAGTHGVALLTAAILGLLLLTDKVLLTAGRVTIITGDQMRY